MSSLTHLSGKIRNLVDTPSRLGGQALVPKHVESERGHGEG